MNKNLAKKLKATFLTTTVLAESMLANVSLAAPPKKRLRTSDQTGAIPQTESVLSNVSQVEPPEKRLESSDQAKLAKPTELQNESTSSSSTGSAEDDKLVPMCDLASASKEDFEKIAARGDHASRDALLTFGKNSGNSNQLDALHALAGSSPEQFEVTAKNGDEISRDALLAIAQFSPDQVEKLNALHALVGYFHNQFEIAKNGDEISRCALLQLGQISPDKIERLDALYALVGHTENDFKKATATGDDISRRALLAIELNSPILVERVAALYTLVGFSLEQFSITNKGDEISKDAFLRLRKISCDIAAQVSTNGDLIGHISKEFDAIIETDNNLLSRALLVIGMNAPDQVEKLNALHALIKCSHVVFNEIAKIGDEVSRYALLAIGQNSPNQEEKLNALYALADFYKNKFHGAGANNSIYRSALLEIGKIADTPEERLAALHTLVMDIQGRSFKRKTWSKKFKYTTNYLNSIQNEPHILQALMDVFTNFNSCDNYRQAAEYIKTKLLKR